jgi:hypothetical protein
MSNQEYPFTISKKAVVVHIDGKGYHVHKNDSRYGDVINAIRTGLFNTIRSILDIKQRMIDGSDGTLYLLDGVVQSDDYVVPTMFGERIVYMSQNNLPMKSYIRFLKNTNDNPDPRAVEETYGFIEHCDLPVTPDGCFLAYKMVTNDFKDIFTKSMDNSVGAEVWMERDLVDDDKNRTCSSGLHFCSEGYLGHYGREGSSQLVIVKINPRDVVSIPTDYHFAKGRCCRYTVVDSMEWDNRLKPTYYDDYTAPEDIKELPVATPEGINGTRWELRETSTGNLLDVYPNRADARSARQYIGVDTTFIWDNAHDVSTGPTPEGWDGPSVDEYTADPDEPVVIEVKDDSFDSGEFSDEQQELDLPDEDDVTEINEDERWEVRQSFNGNLLFTFSSRKLAREYVSADEFIWDTTNNKIEKGRAPFLNWKP